MKGTIIEAVRRRGFCGTEKEYDFLIVQAGARKHMLLKSLFRGPTAIGSQVELDYVAVGNGYRYWPRASQLRKDAIQDVEATGRGEGT